MTASAETISSSAQNIHGFREIILETTWISTRLRFRSVPVRKLPVRLRQRWKSIHVGDFTRAQDDVRLGWFFRLEVPLPSRNS